MASNHLSSLPVSSSTGSRIGLKVKTGYRIGFAEQNLVNPLSTYSAGHSSGAAGDQFSHESVVIPDYARYLFDWLENWQRERQDKLAHPPELVIEYPVKKRFYELDAWRGMAITMMLIKHGLDGWGFSLLPRLTVTLLAFWEPLKIGLIATTAIFFIGTALRNSIIFDQFISTLAPNLEPAWQAIMAYTLAAIPGFWFGVTSVGASAFLGLSGISMAISAMRTTDLNRLRREWLKRGVILLGLGMLVSLLSVLIVPQSPIYFGVLHLFGLSTILMIPFISLPISQVAASAVAILAAGALLTPQLLAGWPWWLLLGLLPVSKVFVDYTPLAPWMGFLLMGLAVGRTIYQEGASRKFDFPELSDLPVIRALSKLGQNSLLIYLAQMPITLLGLAA